MHPINLFFFLHKKIIFLLVASQKKQLQVCITAHCMKLSSSKTMNKVSQGKRKFDFDRNKNGLKVWYCIGSPLDV